ncbi:MAG: response regulator [Anaerolineales bacterium]|nr:response regulator [Anaerolineales bacterium]
MPSLRVLIADDSAELRKSVRQMLAFERGFEVVAVARDGVEALEMARSLQPDVAILDINMPRMDGLTAVRLMPKVSARTLCMIMSSEAERDQLRQAITAGVREYLIKPFSPDEFVAAVRRVAAQAHEAQQQAAAAEAAEAERDRYLMQLVNSYLKTGRMDDEAARIYAAYAQRPGADPSVLARLAEIFCARREWRALRLICERMEKLEGTGAPE